MKKTGTDSRPIFYAVKFLELPFEDIDDYVCVPFSWVILRRSLDRKVLVAYPKNEDPFDTRDRAKRSEKHGHDWDFYLAIIKYESASYQDVDYWIATRNDNDSCAEENLRVGATQPKPATDRNQSISHMAENPYNPRKPVVKNLPIKRSIQSESKSELDKRLKPWTMEEPGCSKSNQPIMIQDDEFIESIQAEETAAASNGKRSYERSTQPQRTEEDTSVPQPGPSNSRLHIHQHCEPNQSKAVIDVDLTTAVIEIGKEDQPPSGQQSCEPESVQEKQISTIRRNNIEQEVRQQEMLAGQSKETNSNSQTHLSSTATAASTLSTNDQTAQTHQHTRQSPSLSSRNSPLNSQPHQTDVRSTGTIHDDQTPSTSGITSNIPSILHNLPNSLKLSDQLHHYMNEKPTLIPVQNPVFKKIRIKNIMKNIETPAQPSSSSISETSSPSTSSTKRKPSIVTQKDSQNVPVVNPRSSIGENRIDQGSLLRGNVKGAQEAQRVPEGQVEISYDLNAIDQRLSRQDASNSTAFQNRSNLGHHPRSCVQLMPGKRTSLAQEYLKRLACMQDNPNESQANDRRVSFEELLMDETFTAQHQPKPTASQPIENLPCSRENPYLPVNLDNLLQKRQRQELLKRYTDSNYSDHGSNSRTIKIRVASDGQHSMNASNQFNQNIEPPQQRQLQPNLDNLLQKRQRQELLKRYTDSNYSDHGSNSRTIKIRVASDGQHSMNASNQFNQNIEPPQQRQLQPNHQNLPRDQSISKVQVGVSIKSKYKSHMCTLQGATKTAPSLHLTNASISMSRGLLNTNDNFTPNDQQAQAILSGGSAKQSNVNISAAPRNIPIEPAYDMHSFEVLVPSCSSSRAQEMQRPSVHDNINQHVRVRKRLVEQSTETNPPIKRLRFEDNNIVRASATVRTPQLEDSACQTDRSITEDHMSPYHEIASDNEVVTDHDVVLDHDMSTNETPVEITNDAYNFQITSASNSPDRPIAPQSPTTTSIYMHPRIILEQKMLNEFSTIFTQMGSTLAYTCEMFNNLRSSILEIADTYKNLLDTVEKFNTLNDSASTPSSSSNATSNVPQATEERRTGRTEGETSGTGTQCNNNVVNEPPRIKQSIRRTFALPPEYDPNDTRWTLKYRQNEPGLVELMPDSNIFVSYGELHNCTRVSRNCITLARLLLLEVFNKSALSVCESLTERISQASNNEGSRRRPQLDTQGCIALLKFVQKHSLQYGWDVSDTKDVLKGMHSKMEEMRFK